MLIALLSLLTLLTGADGLKSSRVPPRLSAMSQIGASARPGAPAAVDSGRRRALGSAVAAAAALPLARFSAFAAEPAAPQVYENAVIGFSFAVPGSFKRQVAGGIFGRAAEALAFGGSVSYNGAYGATIELSTKTLPPGPQFASLDPKSWTAVDAAESVLEGDVLSSTLRRFGGCDAYLFESKYEGERGYTACTLKKDSNFANHLVTLSAHAPIGSWDASKEELLAAVESLNLVDFIADLSAKDLEVVRSSGAR
ncbi:hypothetical protein T492DRAFT_1024941 [Pavlovales sp. CCMP2436]|nr:hypothetical protein T492DRAFT_1024941 [Pavlovales sp. CCMP2436]